RTNSSRATRQSRPSLIPSNPTEANHCSNVAGERVLVWRSAWSHESCSIDESCIGVKKRQKSVSPSREAGRNQMESRRAQLRQSVQPDAACPRDTNKLSTAWG